MATSPSPETPSPKAAEHDHGSHWKILIGLVVGIVLGLILHNATSIVVPAADRADPSSSQLSFLYWSQAAVYWAEGFGKLFLRLMFMIVLPLVFSALTLAVVEIGDLKKLGSMGLRTLGFTAILSVSAVIIGLTLVNTFQPGKAISEAQRTQLSERYATDAEKRVKQSEQSKPIRDVLIDLFPENPIQEMVGAVDGSSKGDGMLAVMVFALVCGMAFTTNPGKAAGFVAWLEGLQLVSSVVINFAMKLAPIGAGCLVFAITSQLGFDILRVLGSFVLTALAGLAIHLFVTYSIVLVVFARMSPITFFRGSAEALLTAFGTSSSSATLPTAMRVATDDLNLPPRVSNFVLTVGATGNQNGTALFEGVVVLFLAQVMGVELKFTQQIQVVLMSVLAGIGTAGVPGGSLPLIVVVMQSVGIPGSAIGIIMGVDRILDMSRTTVNVAGDLVIAACVTESERQIEARTPAVPVEIPTSPPDAPAPPTVPNP